MHALAIWFFILNAHKIFGWKKKHTTGRKTNIKNNLITNQNLPKEVEHRDMEFFRGNNSDITTAFRKDLT